MLRVIRGVKCGGEGLARRLEGQVTVMGGLIQRRYALTRLLLACVLPWDLIRTPSSIELLT